MFSFIHFYSVSMITEYVLWSYGYFAWKNWLRFLLTIFPRITIYFEDQNPSIRWDVPQVAPSHTRVLGDIQTGR